ncbi:hypothetical protein LMG31506_05781 [Cupriavidus yeoncheonensis]|uniref:Uncharacterized protein n=1 Tax=Cupriavidus yeoncheonensis TaxID=1462994 RepID=A0A916IZX1_9BURK|nr:hypothetical protein [Cupriavidus yeoncheonensis]CAG2156678.1 hypothetical protein LMG31506_05781 [Cupriavidus yeoncheonensis]
MFRQHPVVPTDQSIELAGWLVMETELGERHLVGINLSRGSARVSSAIETLDASTMQVTTQTGHVYSLRGIGNVPMEAYLAWGLWCRNHAVLGWRDVTEEYETAMRAYLSGSDYLQ